MSLVSGSIASLVNGVSQQPPWVRLSSQLEKQENMLSSLLSGLTRRPGTKHLALLSTTLSERPFIHVIDRDPTNRFVVVIGGGDLRVFDLSGQERTVSFPDGKDYLASSNPSDGFSAVSVVDYTFIVNRGVTVQATPVPPEPPRYGYVYVRQGAYSANYKVLVNGTVVADYTTPEDIAEEVQTVAIAGHLRELMASSLGADWTVEQRDNTLRVHHKDNLDFTIEARDGGGDNYLKAFRDSVQSFADLPTHMYEDAWVEIVGAGSNAVDSYFVRYDAPSHTWQETVFPGADRGPDPASMPHQLVHNADGTFTFQKAAWEKRKAGDTDSAPDPSFVGRKISDVFFWKGRLGFIADDSVVLSATGKFFRFYPETVTTLLDSDPIDIAVGSTRVAPVRFATPFQGNLALWSETAQFELVADGGVPSPSTVSIEQPSAYPASIRAKPVENGKGIFFAFDRGGFSGVREYITDRSTNTRDALDTTIHVASYIPGTITHLAALRNDEIIMAATEGDPSAIFLYKFHWEGDAKLQSSWSRWSLGDGAEVLALASLGQIALVIVRRDGKVWLETLEIDNGVGEMGLPWSVCLDRRYYLKGTYDASTDMTRWEVPYKQDNLVVVLGQSAGVNAGGPPPGLFQEDDPDTGNSVLYAKGDYSAHDAVVGVRFLSEVILSRITMEDKSGNAGRGRVAITDGRLQLLAVYPSVSDTGFLQVAVARKDGNTVEYTFTPRWVGAKNTILGTYAVDDARWRVPVYQRNDEAIITFRTDSHLPCSILSVDWEGIFTLRSQRA